MDMDINVDYLLKRTREEEGKDKPDDRDRTIKAQLAPRMVDLRHHKKLSDVFSVLGDMTEGTQPHMIPFHDPLALFIPCAFFDNETAALLHLHTDCYMTHGDVSSANGLAYWRNGKIVGVLNDFDGMMYDGRFAGIPPLSEEEKKVATKPNQVEGTMEVLDPD